MVPVFLQMLLVDQVTNRLSLCFLLVNVFSSVGSCIGRWQLLLAGECLICASFVMYHVPVLLVVNLFLCVSYPCSLSSGCATRAGTNLGLSGCVDCDNRRDGCSSRSEQEPGLAACSAPREAVSKVRAAQGIVLCFEFAFSLSMLGGFLEGGRGRFDSVHQRV